MYFEGVCGACKYYTRLLCTTSTASVHLQRISVILFFKRKGALNCGYLVLAGCEAVQTQDKGTVTEWADFDEIFIFKMYQQMLRMRFCDLSLYHVLYLFISLSESSLLWVPPSDSQTSHNKSPQVTRCSFLTELNFPKKWLNISYHYVFVCVCGVNI